MGIKFRFAKFFIGCALLYVGAVVGAMLSGLIGGLMAVAGGYLVYKGLRRSN